jgi:hypothetical protein
MVKMRNFKIILVMRAGQREQKQNAQLSREMREPWQVWVYINLWYILAQNGSLPLWSTK